MTTIHAVASEVNQRLMEPGKRTNEELFGMLVALFSVASVGREKLQTFSERVAKLLIGNVQDFEVRVLLTEVVTRIDWTDQDVSQERTLDHAVGFTCASQCPLREEMCDGILSN